MKKYIRASVDQGGYLIDRKGDIIPISLHVPSTTWTGRGMNFLAPTDAEFLLKQDLITDEEAMTIVAYNLAYYLKENGKESFSVLDVTNFDKWAELRYAPTIRAKTLASFSLCRQLSIVEKLAKDFDTLNKSWYGWLRDNFVKMSRFGNIVEFRISSEDNFDWNKVIIDKVICELDFGPSTSFNIVRESSKGYQAYFLNATISEILRNDKAVLSSTYTHRKIINGELVYE